jgi:hypothetical protein
MDKGGGGAQGAHKMEEPAGCRRRAFGKRAVRMDVVDDYVQEVV